MKNREAKEQLSVLFGCRCLLTNLKTELNLHHLEKVEDGGKTTVRTTTISNKDAHDWVHNEIEPQSIERFNNINECIDLYKKCLELGLNDLIEQYEKELMPIYQQKRIEYIKRRRR